MKNSRLSGPEAWDTASNNEKYGRYLWLGWIDRNGVKQADIQSYETIKEAMLAVGTQGSFRLFEYGCKWQYTWPMASIMLRNFKHGHLNAYKR